MPSIIRSTPFSLDDGGAIVKTILGILFLGILCSMVHLVYYPSPSELSKAEVNINFGDSGDSITASATIRVEAPVDEQDDAAYTSILLPSLPDVSLPDISLPDVSLPDTSLPDISLQMPSFPSPSLPKCCQDWHPDCSWLEHMVEVICKFREEAWNMIVKALLTIRDILKRLLSLICDFLALLLTYITSLIQYVDCNTSCNPWDGCSSKLLRNALDIMDAKDEIVLSWIPVESTTTITSGLTMVSRILISIATMVGFLIIIVLCIFIENSPGKKKIVHKITGLFSNTPTEASSGESDKKEEDKPEKKMKRKRVKAVKDTIGKINVDINTEG